MTEWKPQVRDHQSAEKPTTVIVKIVRNGCYMLIGEVDLHDEEFDDKLAALHACADDRCSTINWHTQDKKPKPVRWLRPCYFCYVALLMAQLGALLTLLVTGRLT